jgi:hypothetical protein
MRGKIIGPIFVMTLLIASSFVYATETTNEKERNIEDENKLYFLNSKNVDSDIFYEGLETNHIAKTTSEDAEEIGLDITENIDIQEDGKADVDITMRISSSKLVDLYKKSLGVPGDADEVDMEIPYQTTRKITLKKDDSTTIEKEVTEPVRERFLEGIAEEQEFLYGIHITEFKSSRIYSTNPDDVLFVNVKAEAIPYVTDIFEEGLSKTLTIEGAPEDTVSRFVSEQMELSKVMIESFQGNQFFTKNVEINLNFPKTATIIDVEKNQKYFDLGSASFLSSLEKKSQTQVELSEEWIIFEGQQIAKGEKIDDLFKIQYTIESTEEIIDFSTVDYGFDMSNFNDDPWSWDFNWPIINLSGESGGVTYSVDVDLYLTLSGYLHVDLGSQVIYADFGILAGLEVDVTISGAWEKTWNLFGGMLFSGDHYHWRGMQAMVVTVHLEPEASLTISVEGTVHVWLNPEADFSMRVGGDIDLQWAWPPVHFEPIFSYSLGGHFDYLIELSCSATIRPSLGFALSLLVFEIIGPRIEPTIYLEGIIGYDSSGGAYWNAELAFDLYVGVQFTRFLHYNWPEPIYHTSIANWKGSFNPVDIAPPTTTLYMGPKVNGYVGPCAFFWFKAKDGGPEGEGIQTTKFQIPEATDSSWHTFDNSLMHLIITNVDDYTVKYYSIDLEDNQESTKTQSVQADLTRPDTGITFDGEHNDNGNDNYEILIDSTKVYLLGKEKGSRKTNVRVWFYAKHESGYETEWKYTDFYGGDSWYGWELTFGDLGRWTVTWVAEDGVWNVRSAQVTIDVKDTFIPPSIELTFPNPGDFIILDRHWGRFSFSMALYLVCTRVECSAYDDETGVAKVIFECGGKSYTDDTPSSGRFSGSLDNVPQGIHTLSVDAYDSKGEWADSDSVRILKLGGS